MTPKDLVTKGQAPLALLGVLSFLWAVYPGWPKLGQLAWADEVKKEVQEASKPAQMAAEAAQAQTVILQKQLNLQRAQQLERDLFAAIIEKCEAKKKGSSARIWTERVQSLKAQYQELTQREYPEPDCSDL